MVNGLTMNILIHYSDNCHNVMVWWDLSVDTRAQSPTTEEKEKSDAKNTHITPNSTRLNSANISPFSISSNKYLESLLWLPVAPGAEFKICTVVISKCSQCPTSPLEHHAVPSAGLIVVPSVAKSGLGGVEQSVIGLLILWKRSCSRCKRSWNPLYTLSKSTILFGRADSQGGNRFYAGC